MDPFSGDDTFGNRGFHGRLSGRDRDPCRSFRPIPGRHRDRRFPEARRPWNIFPGFPIIFREKSGHLNAFSGVVTFNQQSPSGLEAAQKESGIGRRDRRQAARGQVVPLSVGGIPQECRNRSGPASEANRRFIRESWIHQNRGGSFLRPLFESTSSHCPKTRNRDSGFRPSRRRRGACGRRTGPLGGSGGSPGRCCGVRSRPGLRIRILADDYPELSGAGPLSENGDSAGAHPVGEPHPELNIDCRDVLFPRALNKQERCASPLGWTTFIKRSV